MFVNNIEMVTFKPTNYADDLHVAYTQYANALISVRALLNYCENCFLIVTYYYHLLSQI